MIDFAALMNFAFENRLYESEVHGIEHWHQVEYNGLLLAKKTGADIDVVRLCLRFSMIRSVWMMLTTENMAHVAQNLHSAVVKKIALSWTMSALAGSMMRAASTRFSRVRELLR